MTVRAFFTAQEQGQRQSSGGREQERRWRETGMWAYHSHQTGKAFIHKPPTCQKFNLSCFKNFLAGRYRKSEGQLTIVTLETMYLLGYKTVVISLLKNDKTILMGTNFLGFHFWGTFFYIIWNLYNHCKNGWMEPLYSFSGVSLRSFEFTFQLYV